MMDFSAPIEEQAMSLLRKMKEVGDWALRGDPRAKPYLDADAVRVVGDEAQFSKRFIEVYTDELVAERMIPVDKLIEATKKLIKEGA